MLLFAVELADGTVYLVSAANVSVAVAECERRSQRRPLYVWTFQGAHRRQVLPTD